MKKSLLVFFIILVPVGLYFAVRYFNLGFGLSRQQASGLSVSERMAILQAQRQNDWATQYPGGWEVFYDGVGTASGDKKECDPNAVYVPHQLYWDVPFDDDWNEPDVVANSFAPNTPSCGFLTVNRVSNPAYNHRNSQFWRRDEFVSKATGITVEARFHVEPDSSPQGVSLDIMDKTDFVRIVFYPGSPGAIGIDDTQSTDPTITHRQWDTSADHTYRVVKAPYSSVVTVYVDNSPNAILTGTAGPMSTDLLNNYYNYTDYSVISFGNDVAFPAHYVLDFIRYRTGAAPYTFGTPAPPPSPRQPPALPAQATSADEGFNTGFDGTALPKICSSANPCVDGDFGISGSIGAWHLLRDGTIDYNGLYTDPPTGKIYDVRSSVDITGVPGLVNKGGVTIEIRAKVMPDSKERAFPITYFDEVGSVTLVLSPDKVESMLGTEAGGFTGVPLPNPDQFHTYRIVRKPDDLYAYIYLDNDPVPIIADQHLAGGALTTPTLKFGYLNYPVLDANAHVIIDYIRWHDGALAPFGVLTTPTPTPVTGSISVSPATVIAGAPVTVSWSGISSSTGRDWMGWYASGATDRTLDPGWFYVNCSRIPTSAQTNGSCTFNIPATATPGAYEFRLFSNDTYNKIATSIPVTVTLPGASNKPGDVDGNGRVDIFDYNILVGTYGSTTDLRADLNKDRVINLPDYNILVTNFGT